MSIIQSLVARATSHKKKKIKNITHIILFLFFYFSVHEKNLNLTFQRLSNIKRI